MNIVRSKHNLAIRLTPERGDHMIDEHAELAMFQAQVLLTVAVVGSCWLCAKWKLANGWLSCIVKQKLMVLLLQLF